MKQKLMALALLAVLIVLVFVGYISFGNGQQLTLNHRIEKLGCLVLESQRWYRHEYIVSGKLVAQARREALINRFTYGLQERLDRFNKEIKMSYKQVQSIPNAYKLIDDIIQELGKRLGLIKESGT
jgi:hypothetical protein